MSSLRYGWYFLLPLLPACSLWKEQVQPPVAPSPETRYQRSDLDELLLYGAELAALSEEGRREECARLKALSSATPSIGVHLHLLQIQSVLEGCGDQQATLDTLGREQEHLTEVPVRRWLAFHEQILKAWQAKTRQCQALEKKLQETHKTMQKNRKQVKSRESQLLELKDKLEALKSIEQNLGGVDEGRKP